MPEKTLQFSGLLGGWAGGFWAMEKFRHKTRKQAFLVPYYACVAANVVLSAGAVYAVKGGEESRRLLHSLTNSKDAKKITREIIRMIKRVR